MRRILRAVLAATVVTGGACGQVREAAAQAGHQYAILVGVQKYAKSSGLRDLEYAERDVQALAEVLIESGYRASNVTLLTQKKALEENDLKYLPMRKNILAEIEGRLALLDREDTILIAFAGHGLQFSKEKECWFCPADADVGDRDTLVSLSSVYKSLEGSKAGFKFVICDACRNSPLAAGVRRVVVDIESRSRPQEIEPPGGVAVLYSCSPGEVAFENAKLGHGVFFHFLIDGLKGNADLDKDRQVDLLELAKYAQKQVKDYVFAEYDRATQVPQLFGTTRGLFPLVSLGPGRGEPADVVPRGELTVVVSATADVLIGEKIVATVRKGDRFFVEKEQDGWLWIKARSMTEPLGWIRKQHLAPAPAKAGPRDVLVQWADAKRDAWWPAVVLRSEGGKMLIHYYGHDAEWDEWVAGDRMTAVDKPFLPFTHMVEWKGRQWPARVIARNGNQAQVEYIGFNSVWSEWLDANELIELNPDDAALKRINADISR